MQRIGGGPDRLRGRIEVDSHGVAHAGNNVGRTFVSAVGQSGGVAGRKSRCRGRTSDQIRLAVVINDSGSRRNERDKTAAIGVVRNSALSIARGDRQNSWIS